jgi:hypothetical protein
MRFDRKYRFLFVNTLEPDGIQDLMYSGLAKIVTPANIIEFPWNPWYHINKRKYPSNLGYVKHSIISSMIAKLKSRQFDFVIVAASKPKCFENYLKIIESIPSTIPLVYLDGGDFSMPEGDLKRMGREDLYYEVINKRPFDAIFKREYLEEDSLGQNVWPLQFSFNRDRIPEDLPNEKKYNVAFWAVESNPIRTKALELLENKFDCRENGTVRNQVFKKYRRKGDFYLREVASCKIVINCPGVGWDTQRYWEIPSIGRFMISVRPPLKIPNNFRDKEHIVFCKDDLSDLVELCEYYLLHEDEREKIAMNAKEFSLKYHTNISRTEYLIEKIETLL